MRGLEGLDLCSWLFSVEVGVNNGLLGGRQVALRLLYR